MINWIKSLPTACPECGEGEIKTEFLKEGELVTCPICGAELEVTKEGNLVVLQIEGEDFGE